MLYYDWAAESGYEDCYGVGFESPGMPTLLILSKKKSFDDEIIYIIAPSSLTGYERLELLDYFVIYLS